MIAVYAPAQVSPPLYLEPITIDQGLSQGYVTGIIQDKKGFMWFTTGDGLNKYDGYAFTVYHHDPVDTTTLGSDDLVSVFEDSKERLWIGTRHNGVDLFDREKGRFIHIRHTDANSLRSDDVMRITEDKERAIWIQTRLGIDRMEIVSDKPVQGYSHIPDSYSNQDFVFTHITLDSAFEAAKEKSGAPAVFVDSRARVLVTTNNKVWEVKFSSMSRSYRLVERYHFPVRDSAVTATVLEDTVSRYLLVNTGQIIRFSEGNFRLAEIIDTSDHMLSPSVIDKRQRFWILKEQEFKRIGIQSGRLENVTASEPALKKALSYSAVLYTDRNGVVWIGTSGYGILKYTAEKERFHHLLAGQYVYQILKCGDGKLITSNFQELTIKKDRPFVNNSLVNPTVKKNFRTEPCFLLL